MYKSDQAGISFSLNMFQSLALKSGVTAINNFALDLENNVMGLFFLPQRGTTLFSLRHQILYIEFVPTHCNFVLINIRSQY